MHKIIQTFIHEAPLQRLPDPVAHRHEHLLIHCSLQQKKGICSTHVYTQMLDEWLMKKDKLRFHPFYVRFSRSSSTILLRLYIASVFIPNPNIYNEIIVLVVPFLTFECLCFARSWTVFVHFI